MPAGATLISPWVDLAHSFPSVGGEGKGDYIPANGFIYRPDLVWPPPPDPRNAIEQVLVGEEEMVKDGMDIKIRLEEQVQVSSLSCAIGLCCPDRSPADVLPQPTPQPSSHLARQCRLSRRSATSLHRQCHFATLLCTHLSHIVSSIAVLRWIGASPRRNHGEAHLSPECHNHCRNDLRRLSQYIAHKAANPKSYPPPPRIFQDYPSQKVQLEAHHAPTKVQLQVFDGGCHVATTLSITSLAKYVSPLYLCFQLVRVNSEPILADVPRGRQRRALLPGRGSHA